MDIKPGAVLKCNNLEEQPEILHSSWNRVLCLCTTSKYLWTVKSLTKAIDFKECAYTTSSIHIMQKGAILLDFGVIFLTL